MEGNRIIQQLEDNARRMRALAEGAAPEWARQRPEPDAWSLLEVICHLHDEECEDFRPRLDIMLHKPEERWSPIDPQG